MDDTFAQRAPRQTRSAEEDSAAGPGSMDEEVARSNERLRFLLAAADTLCASLDYEATLQNVVRVAAPVLADLCVLQVIDGAGTRRLSHAPALAEAGGGEPHEASGRLALLEDAAAALPGESGFHPEIGDRLAQEVEEIPAHLTRLGALGLRSVIKVPLCVRGEQLGSLTLCFSASGFGASERRHTRADLHMAGELARRAAIAIDNARLFSDSQEKRRLSEQANRAKDEFLAVVSHDLRAPLNAIVGWSKLLRRDRMKDNATWDKGLTIIERNAMAQVKLIEDILDVSRIISGKLRIELRELDLDAVIRASLEAIRSAAEDKGVELLVSTEPGTQVLGDPERLQQVAWNLLSNAVKFTPKGGFIEVRLETSAQRARIIVRDSGKGIDPAFLPHVFERFRQADSSAARREGGLGLGLAIVRHVVELHCGTVHAESEGEGQGAVFTVELPLHAERPRAAEPAPHAPLESDPALLLMRLDGLRVLVVDDELDAREMVAMLLSVAGAEVEAVSSAAQAMERLGTFAADALVSDVGMPGDDGYTLIQRIRASSAPYAQIPAIALTAYAGPDDIRRAVLAGFHAHLPKPVEPATLTALVANLTGASTAPLAGTMDGHEH